MTIIKWQAKEYKEHSRGVNWFWFFWSASLLLAFLVFYFFKDIIFAMLILSFSFLVHIISLKKPQKKIYEIQDKGFVLDNGQRKIAFSFIESYNIDKKNRKILLNTKNLLEPLVYIPYRKNQDIDKVDRFLSTKIKKDKNLKTLPLENLFNKIFGF